MWILMVSTAAGPRLPHVLEIEKPYQVDDELGAELVTARAAKEIPDPTPKKADAPAEVAAMDAGEKAMDPASEKKSESLIDKLTGKKPEGAADQDGEAEQQKKKAAAKKS